MILLRIICGCFILLLVGCKAQPSTDNTPGRDIEVTTERLESNQVITKTDGSNLSLGNKVNTVLKFEGENNTIVFERYNVLDFNDGTADTLILDFSDKVVVFKTVNAVKQNFDLGLKIRIAEWDFQGDSLVFEYDGKLTGEEKLGMAEKLEELFFNSSAVNNAQINDMASVIFWAYYTEHDQGDPLATYNLGRIFYYGLMGQVKNEEKGLELLKQSARKNCEEAQALLELMVIDWD